MLITGCASATASKRAELRITAVADLECEGPQLKVQEVDFNTAGVKGCGRRATYRWSNQYAAWLRQDNSDLSERSARLTD